MKTYHWTYRDGDYATVVTSDTAEKAAIKIMARLVDENRPLPLLVIRCDDGQVFTVRLQLTITSTAKSPKT